MESLFTVDFQEKMMSAWEVLVVFLIPFGGGIPAGAVLAQKRGLHWVLMTLIYLVSDIILAIAFEPLLLFLAKKSETSPRLKFLKESMIQSLNTSMRLTIGRFDFKPKPFSLILISFGTDPMTGRSVAFAAGHGFLSGWILTILGDLLYFAVISISTLLLNDILGNGTLAVIIILVSMIAVPYLFRKIKEKIRSFREASS